MLELYSLTFLSIFVNICRYICKYKFIVYNNSNNNGFYKVSYPGKTISKTLYMYKNQEYKIVTNKKKKRTKNQDKSMGYERLKRKVFKHFLKLSVDSLDRTTGGKLFQIFGPTTLKDPMLAKLVQHLANGMLLLVEDLSE